MDRVLTGPRRVMVLALAALFVAAAAARAGTANGGLRHAPGNPLLGIKWGVYEGPGGGVWPAYEAAHGRDRRLLARIALEPRAPWDGFWDGNARAAARASIRYSTQGDPNALTQVAIFRLHPWETCSGSWSAANQAGYRAWARGYAAGIGRARVAVILQPDLPFAVCAPSSVPEQLTAYAAKVLGALPHTTVYVDAGAYAWYKPAQMAQMLERSGIWHSRGFALNVSQYGATDQQIQWGAQINQALAAAGARDKHFVINTDENGSPYLAGQIPGGGGASNYTPRCTRPRQRLCMRLGIPPTTDVANPRWGLTAADRAIAQQQVDAYMWLGEPWLYNGGGFVLSYALDLAADDPF